MQGKQNNAEEMAKIWVNILSAVQNQGLSFVLMFAMAFYFHSENKGLKEQINMCNADKVEALRKIVESNNVIMQNFSFYLKENQ